MSDKSLEKRGKTNLQIIFSILSLFVFDFWLLAVAGPFIEYKVYDTMVFLLFLLGSEVALQAIGIETLVRRKKLLSAFFCQLICLVGAIFIDLFRRAVTGVEIGFCAEELFLNISGFTLLFALRWGWLLWKKKEGVFFSSASCSLFSMGSFLFLLSAYAGFTWSFVFFTVHLSFFYFGILYFLIDWITRKKDCGFFKAVAYFAGSLCYTIMLSLVPAYAIGFYRELGWVYLLLAACFLLYCGVNELCVWYKKGKKV